MQFGYFDDERREYVITRPDTPLPWINYLGCENYFGIISNTAGGYSFFKDARLRRLTPTVITTPLWTRADDIFICATTHDRIPTDPYSGRQPGSRLASFWISTNAAMDSATPPSAPGWRGLKPKSAISFLWEKASKPGS